MSASTVSITANPAARRRPLLAADKKSNAIEFLSNDRLNGVDPANNNVLSSDRLNTDLSHHSIRGEAALERTSKDISHVKTTALGNSTDFPRRSRKAGAKSEKPRWQTVLSVFTKNFALLIALIGFVQMVKLAFLKSWDPMMGTQMALSESEARIAEVESFVKNSVKMIQVQVEVVNKKLDTEVGGLRKVIDNKIDDKIMFLERELKQLASRSEGLEKSLGELKAVEWLSKEDFNKFLEEFQKQKGVGLGQSENDASLDDIRAYAREIVLKEVEKHASDGLGRVDYALASGGGMVVKHSDPYFTGKVRNWFWTTTRGGVYPDADKMLKPSFGEPGQCFPLKGSTGYVQIRLRTAVIPEAVTLEHVAKSVAYDRSSAPKNCRVSGWLEGHNMDSAIDKEKLFLLTEFTYDLEKSNAQTFNVLDSATSAIVDTIRLDFTSNHGSSSHTCIYRLRVHGYEPDSVSMMAMES